MVSLCLQTSSRTVRQFNSWQNWSFVHDAVERQRWLIERTEDVRSSIRLMSKACSFPIKVCLIGFCLLGCQSIPPNTGLPLEFTSVDRPAEADQFPNWPASPTELERLLPQQLAAGRFEVREKAGTAYGLGGAESIELYLPEIDEEVRIKWKEMPRKTLDEYNNRARKTIAAYHMQKLFLDAEDYVVPLSFAICQPIEGEERPSVPGTNCTLGAVSVWLQDVTFADVLYDEARFVADPTYAYYLSNFNLFTYLANHRDAKMSNALVSEEDARRQVFSIDNDIAFDAFVYNYFIDQWDEIFVAALRKNSIDRLRRLEREDLDFLGVVAQFETDDRNVLVPVAPGENLDPNRPVRITGGGVQLGLAKYEIEGLWSRIQWLLKRVDDGEIPVFEG